MKRLIYGFVVALLAFTFSAFTTLKQTWTFYALFPDGNYHRISYDPSHCIANTGSTCAWKWNTPGGSPGQDVISPQMMSLYIGTGQFSAFGDPNKKYVP